MSDENKSLLSLALNLERLLIENEGELNDEIEALIKVNETDLATKIDSYYYIIERMKNAAAYYKAEAEKLNNIKKSCEALEDRLKTRLKETMQFTNRTEVAGLRHRFVLTDSQPKLIITDESKIPNEYKIIKTEIDKSALRVALVHGVKTEGARLEQTCALRSFKVNPASKKSELTEGK